MGRAQSFMLNYNNPISCYKILQIENFY